MKLIKIFALLVLLISLNSCGLYRPTDAKEFPPDPALRVKKNMEEFSFLENSTNLCSLSF